MRGPGDAEYPAVGSAALASPQHQPQPCWSRLTQGSPLPSWGVMGSCPLLGFSRKDCGSWKSRGPWGPLELDSRRLSGALSVICPRESDEVTHSCPHSQGSRGTSFQKGLRNLQSKAAACVEGEASTLVRGPWEHELFPPSLHR